MTEKAWLIERANPSYPHTSAGQFLGFSGSTGTHPAGRFVWMDTVTNALRFARQIDAEFFVAAMLKQSLTLEHGETLKGLRDGDPRPLAVEHAWSDGAESASQGGISDAQIKHMVNRFLAWRLPEHFRPDAGISFKPEFNEHTPFPSRHQPSGTNLFDATQAEAMVRHMVEGMPDAAPTPPTQPKDTP